MQRLDVRAWVQTHERCEPAFVFRIQTPPNLDGFEFRLFFQRQRCERGRGIRKCGFAIQRQAFAQRHEFAVGAREVGGGSGIDRGLDPLPVWSVPRHWHVMGEEHRHIDR